VGAQSGDQGFVDAQYSSGRITSLVTVDEESVDAALWYRKLPNRDICSRSSSSAACIPRRGVTKDYQQSVRWFRAPPSRVMPNPSITRTTLCQRRGVARNDATAHSGIVRLPNKGFHSHSITWGFLREGHAVAERQRRSLCLVALAEKNGLAAASNRKLILGLLTPEERRVRKVSCRSGVRPRCRDRNRRFYSMVHAWVKQYSPRDSKRST